MVIRYDKTRGSHDVLSLFSGTNGVDFDPVLSVDKRHEEVAGEDCSCGVNPWVK